MEDVKSILLYVDKNECWICPECETENKKNELFCVLCNYGAKIKASANNQEEYDKASEESDTVQQTKVQKQEKEKHIYIKRYNLSAAFIAIVLGVLMLIILLLALQKNNILN